MDGWEWELLQRLFRELAEWGWSTVGFFSPLRGLLSGLELLRWLKGSGNMSAGNASTCKRLFLPSDLPFCCCCLFRALFDQWKLVVLHLVYLKLVMQRTKWFWLAANRGYSNAWLLVNRIACSGFMKNHMGPETRCGYNWNLRFIGTVRIVAQICSWGPTYFFGMNHWVVNSLCEFQPATKYWWLDHIFCCIDGICFMWWSNMFSRVTCVPEGECVPRCSKEYAVLR